MTHQPNPTTTHRTPVWDDGSPVEVAHYGTRCDRCNGEHSPLFVLDPGAPADLENGPSVNEVPTIVCAACFWSDDDEPGLDSTTTSTFAVTDTTTGEVREHAATWLAGCAAIDYWQHRTRHQHVIQPEGDGDVIDLTDCGACGYGAAR